MGVVGGDSRSEGVSGCLYLKLYGDFGRMMEKKAICWSRKPCQEDTRRHLQSNHG